MNHWHIGPYLLSGDGVLRLGSQLIPLSPLQRKLLLCFVQHAGQLVERHQLFAEVWGHHKVSDVSLARAVHSLRQVFDRGPLGHGVISTSYGSGYLFTAPVKASAAPLDPSESSPISTPSPQALDYYFEARVAARHFDPLQLQRSQEMLQRCLQRSPAFSEAILFLVSVVLDRCRWGLLASTPAGAEVEALLHRAEQLNAPPQDVLALRAETTSLLHWQPSQVDETLGRWLPNQLGYGLPLLSWVRHLLATGRAQEGLTLLQPQLDGQLPMGWTLAAQLTFQLGHTKAAMEMLRGQLRMDGSLPSSHLFLALLQAHAGEPTAALNSLNQCHLPLQPFQGFQAAVAYVLARVGESARAEALLQQAIGKPGDCLGIPSLWGLTAIVLGQREHSDAFFQMAVQTRCYQAPFVAQSPLLAPYVDEPGVSAFLQRIAKIFPSIPRGSTLNRAHSRG